jgi:hypothetical protein
MALLFSETFLSYQVTEAALAAAANCILPSTLSN